MISYRSGSFRGHYHQLVPLFEAHWKELGFRGGPEELKLNTPLYLQLEDSGLYKCYGGFNEKDELVAYASFFLNRHHHHADQTFAQGDCFYVDPKYRTGSVGLKLIKFAEKELSKVGA